LSFIPPWRDYSDAAAIPKEEAM